MWLTFSKVLVRRFKPGDALRQQIKVESIRLAAMIATGESEYRAGSLIERPSG